MSAYVRQGVNVPRILTLVAIIAGIAGTLFGLATGDPYALAVPPLVAVAGGFASLYSRRRPTTPSASIDLPCHLVLSAILIISTLAVVAYVRAPGYERPFATHVLVVALYVLTAVAIYAFESAPAQLSIVLSTAVFHRALVYYASATQLGLDALFHNRMAEQIAATGSLAPLAAASTKYWYTPAYHVVVGMSSAVSGLPVRDTAFLVITVPAVVVPVLVIYSLLRPVWGTRAGALGGLLFVMGDRAISWSVHVTTTTLGLVLFCVVLIAAVRYVRTGSRRYSLIFAIALVAQYLNHQVSLFVTAVVVSSLLVFESLRDGSSVFRGCLAAAPLIGASALQAAVTKRSGPSGESSVFAVVTSNVRAALSGGSGGTAFPADASAVLAGSSALSVVHVLGFAGLFGAAVLGGLYWLDAGPDRKFALGLGFAVAVTFTFTFVLPIAGINVLFPLRWFPFLYLLLAVLAAPGFVELFSVVRNVVSPSGWWIPVAIVLVSALLVAPYAALMTWNYPGAPDGPVIDDSPGAQRLSATATEAATYDHLAEHGGERMVVADRTARQMIERHYGRPAVTYQAQHGPPPEPVYTEDSLFVDRAYAHTSHASYLYGYDDRWTVVFGPLAVDRSSRSTVYTSGPDHVLHRD